MSPPAIWVLLHDLGRSGVPVALERMVRWQACTEAASGSIHVVAGRDGPLHEALARSAATVTAIEPATGRRGPTQAMLAASQLAGRPVGTAAHAAWCRQQVRKLPRPDIVLVQGSGAWPLATALAPAFGGARLVLHLHELELGIERAGVTDLEAMVSMPDLVLGVSGPVEDLAVRLGASPDRVHRISGSVDAPPDGWDGPLPAVRDPGAVASVGETSWRKGADRALAAAHALGRQRPGLRWTWVGEAAPSAWQFAVGAADALARVPATADPWATVAGSAALVIPSREDPLPLVAVEAGARGVPVVAARTGGLPELLADDRGLLVDGDDLDALVAAVSTCLDDPDAARQRAERLRTHVRQEHATDVVGPRWLAAVVGSP